MKKTNQLCCLKSANKTFFIRMILLTVIFNLVQILTFAQTASEVLESGQKVKSHEKIFLQYDNKTFKYALSRSLQDHTNPIDFMNLKDSTIFLMAKNGINIYMRPLNPLNFSYKKEITQVIDPINLAATKSLATIIGVISSTNKNINFSATKGFNKNWNTTKENQKEIIQNLAVEDTCENFKKIETQLTNLQALLIHNKKEEIISLFNELKALSFLEQESTLNEIEKLKSAQKPIIDHFEKIKTQISQLTDSINGYNCTTTGGFVTKNLFALILKDFNLIATEQHKRLNHLLTAFKMIEDMAATAKIGGGADGLRWCIKLDEVSSNEDKISILAVNIKESGLKLSDKKEIENIETKDILKTVLRIRKFQLFVPEVSVGTAFTFFKYKTYGTTTDANGQQYIGEPKENTIRNLNITTMVNWNLYLPHSPIHPLIQFGAGVNEGLPTLLAGAGLRFGNASNNRIRLTGGIAMTWIKELNKLKVGDKVSGTADIENDSSYQFSWPPKPYIGLQYNF